MTYKKARKQCLKYLRRVGFSFQEAAEMVSALKRGYFSGPDFIPPIERFPMWDIYPVLKKHGYGYRYTNPSDWYYEEDDSRETWEQEHTLYVSSSEVVFFKENKEVKLQCY